MVQLMEIELCLLLWRSEGDLRLYLCRADAFNLKSPFYKPFRRISDIYLSFDLNLRFTFDSPPNCEYPLYSQLILFGYKYESRPPYVLLIKKHAPATNRSGVSMSTAHPLLCEQSIELSRHLFISHHNHADSLDKLPPASVAYVNRLTNRG